MTRKPKQVTSFYEKASGRRVVMGVREYIIPKRPDKRAFPPHGEVPVLLTILIERSKYHPKTARRMKEERKAIARCLNGVIRWQDVVLPGEMERAA